MRIRLGKGWRLAITITCLGLIAAACSGDDDDSGVQAGGATSTSAGTSATTTGTTAAGKKGGVVTIAAEQEGDCMDWMGACGGSSWAYWSVGANTMPRAFDIAKDGDNWVYKTSSLLTGDPQLVTTPKQTVTYHINPKAVWSDGQPITSTDFKYTWDQVAHADQIYDRTGYSQVESVDDSKPDTAVVTFSTPYAGWHQLFGGQFGIYPSHLLQGKDRDAEMKDGYTWSGGPWKLDHWTKGVEAVLVPNTAYWGTVPLLDKLVFTLVADTASEFKAIQAGEALAAYPQPQLDVVAAIGSGIEGFKSDVNAATTPNIEALWINNSKAPFDDKVVRQALAYAIDRDAVVNKLFGGLGVKTAQQTLEAGLVQAYTDPQGFAAYKLDLNKVTTLMTGDGWAKGSDGIWAKGGNRASFAVITTAGNQRRETTEQILQDELKQAGFEMTVANQKASDLFGKTLPNGDYQAAIYAQVLTALEPNANTLFNSKNIPGPSNSNSGQNWQRVNITSLDPTLDKLDTSLDETARKQAGKDAIKVLADNMVSLPLDPLPNIFLHSTKITGKVADNPILGPFSSSNEWSLA